jgi:hypothetical protein
MVRRKRFEFYELSISISRVLVSSPHLTSHVRLPPFHPRTRNSNSGLAPHEKLTLAIKSTIPLEIPNVRSTLSHSQERDDVSMQEYHQGSNLSIRTGSFWVMKQPASGSRGRGDTRRMRGGRRGEGGKEVVR